MGIKFYLHNLDLLLDKISLLWYNINIKGTKLNP